MDLLKAESPYVDHPPVSPLGKGGLFGVVLLVLLASGCETAGTRLVDVRISDAETRVTYRSGTEIGEGFKGRVSVSRGVSGARVVIDGQGGPVDPSSGHEATVDLAEKISKGITSGARQGFAPGL